MLGVDLIIALALLLSVASTLLCVVYGWLRWDADDDTTPMAELAPLSDESENPSHPEREL